MPGAVGEFERELGRPLDIVHSYHGWKGDFPGRKDTGTVAAGRRYMLLTWAGADTREIVGGRHDELIRRQARAVRDTGRPVFLRWQQDMDQAYQTGRVHSARDFIAAWKHLRMIFWQEGVNNVAWVWCPSAGGFGAGSGARSAQSYYPGDDQVDWVCADAQAGGGRDYRDLSETLQPFLEWAAERPKPIMVAEFGAPRSYGVRRAEWLRRAAETLQNPQIKAVVYFNSDEQAAERGDERHRYAVTGDKRATSALRELATTPYFNPRNLPVTTGG